MTDGILMRARYDALQQIVADCERAGQQPKQEWLDALTALTQMLDLPVVPPPPLPPPPQPSAAQPFKPGERIPITVDEDMERVVKEVLLVWAARFCVFQSGGKLFEIQTDKGHELKFLVSEPGTPRLLQVGTARARALAARECMFGIEKRDKDGTPAVQRCLPPDWLGGAIVTRPTFDRIPIIAALAQAPTLRRDGQLIWERGYDASTGIYLASDLKVDVPEEPTREDAKRAADALLDLVSDFDFVNPAGRAAWLAGVLSVAARHTFAGPAPIVIVDASKRGSGKTTLVDIASIITTGVKASRMFYTDDDVEMDKRITALALAGEQLVLIDNIVGKLASPPLDAALTSDSYRGRVLGKTEMTQALPMKICWFATGNGLTIGADMSRRTILARLEPPMDHPEDRTGPRPGQVWKYPDLISYVTENRAVLLSYALTIIKAYVRAGRPSMGLRPMGSFEAWSAVVRSAIVWAGFADPCETIKDARGADLEDQAMRRMVACWPVADGVEITAAGLIEWANTDAPLALDPSKRKAFEETRAIREQWRSALLEWLPAKRGDLPTARDLGYALRGTKGNIVEGLKIEAGKPVMSGVPWKRVRVGEAPRTEGEPTKTESQPAELQSLFTVVR